MSVKTRTMKYFCSLVAILLSLSLSAQRPQADTFETKEGELTVQPILHGTLALNFDEKLIIVDPFGGAAAFSGLENPDYVLITDVHGDHFNETSLALLKLDGAQIIAPQAVYDMMDSALQQKTKILGNGQSMEMGKVKLAAIPMYNLPETDDSRHPKGRGNGYLLTMADKTVYISGDTEDIAEMRQLQNVDLAFVCMNLPYTMNIEQAADAVLAFKPKVIYPYHYRGKPDMSDTKAFKALVDAGEEDIEVRLRNWYPSY